LEASRLPLPTAPLKVPTLGALRAALMDQAVAAELLATNRLPRRRIGERPPDIGVSSEPSGHFVSDE